MPESSYSILYSDSGPSIIYGAEERSPSTGYGHTSRSQDESSCPSLMATGHSQTEESLPPESNPPEVLTEDCLLVPSDQEDSETQVPPFHHVELARRKESFVNSSDGESGDLTRKHGSWRHLFESELGRRFWFIQKWRGFTPKMVKK